MKFSSVMSSVIVLLLSALPLVKGEGAEIDNVVSVGELNGADPEMPVVVLEDPKESSEEAVSETPPSTLEPVDIPAVVESELLNEAAIPLTVEVEVNTNEPIKDFVPIETNDEATQEEEEEEVAPVAEPVSKEDQIRMSKMGAAARAKEAKRLASKARAKSKGAKKPKGDIPKKRRR